LTWARLCAGADRPAAEDVAVELARLLLGLDVELPAQRVDACLILPKRGGAPSELYVQTHHCTMGDLLEGIERKKP